MRRRAFIAALGGAAVWPVVAWAQQPGKVPNHRFPINGFGFRQRQWTVAFVERLPELGYVEGRTSRLSTDGRRDTASASARGGGRLCQS